MSGETVEDGGHWKAWNYLLIGITILVAVLIALYCASRRLYERLARRRRRRRVRFVDIVEDAYFTTRDELEIKPGSGHVPPPISVSTKAESFLVQVEPGLPAVLCHKATSEISEIQLGKFYELKLSPSSILNNNFLPNDYMNNNVPDTVVCAMSPDVPGPGPSSNLPATDTGGTNRIILFSGLMSGILGPAYQFLISILQPEADPNLVVTPPEPEPRNVGEEIKRLTTTMNAGLISILDFCQAEGSPHNMQTEKASASDPNTKEQDRQKDADSEFERNSSASAVPPKQTSQSSTKPKDKKRRKCC